MQRGAGTFRRVVAGLLAVVLLALPGAAIRHASAALTQQQATEHCVTHADASALVQASLHAHTVILVEESGQPCDRPGGEHGMSCCVAAQCALAVGALPPEQANAPPPGTAVRYLAPAHARLGIEIPPSLPPPRRGA